MSLGAAEYLQKDLATPDVLLETVRRVAQQLKRERLRNSDGEAHADTAPQLRTEYLNLLLSGTAENLRTAPYQLEKWGLLKRGAPFTVGLLTVQMPDTGSQRAQPLTLTRGARRSGLNLARARLTARPAGWADWIQPPGLFFCFNPAN